MSAIVFQIPSADKALILDTFEQLTYPFIAEGWMDLRLGAFISLTKNTNNDDTTGLSETATPPPADFSSRVHMGFGSGALGTDNFFGLCSSAITEDTAQHSIVEAGDVATRWRYKGIAGKALLAIDNHVIVQDNAGTIFGPEMSQDAAANGGRASLFMLRMVRASGTSSTISNFYYAKTTRGGTDYADANVWSDNPTIGLIREHLASATWTAVLAAQTFTAVPERLVFFWPYFLSKLRIHSLAIEKFA